MIAFPELRPDGDWPEPPPPTFRLVRLERQAEHDRIGRLAFDVIVKVNGTFSIGPCLYLLASVDTRSGFALPEHTPKTHHNGLMMAIVDQDRAYEALGELEERVLGHARRIAPPEPPSQDDDAFYYAPASGTVLEEPPAWATETVPYDGADLAMYGDVEA
jgi:hypothetical protein